MTAQSTTRCPTCKTLFHITPEQRKAAGGRVRCGRCSTLFSAHTQHVISPSPITSPQSSTQPAENMLFNLDTTLPTIRSKPRHWPANLLILLLCLLIIGQIIWFNQIRWRAATPLSPLYDQFDLAPWQDIKQIHNDHLVVQSHPDYEDALRVSLQLKNKAPIAQPFPRLQLIFSNLQGEVVASRVFTPELYLDTERFDLNAMPIDTPLQFQIDLLAPSEKALSYQLKLVPAS